MPFIGNKPSAVPLTSADITDNVITSAKIVDGTITNTDIASSIITGQTAETSIDGADSILIYDDSATALRKMTRTNFVAGIGGSNTPAFQAYLSSNQSVTNGAFVKLQANTEDFDTASCYDNSTNYRFTPNVAGKYFVYGGISASGNAADNQISTTRIYKNGSGIDFSDNSLRMDYTASSNFSTLTSHVTHIIEMNGTSDYLECFGMSQKSNGSGDVFQLKLSKWGAFKLL